MRMFRIQTQFISVIDDLVKARELIPNPESEDFQSHDIVSYPIIMSSNAGWYIGSICTFYSQECNGWQIAPYDRYTEYMTEEEALRYYRAYYGEHKSVYLPEDPVNTSIH
jgi:hypothetical protein